MLGLIREIWIWSDFEALMAAMDEYGGPPTGLIVRPMVRGRHTWHGLGDVLKARDDARDYFTQLVHDAERVEAETGIEPAWCLQRFADNEGEGVTVEKLWPYWAVAGWELCNLLFERYRDTPPPGIVLHSEDRTDGDRRLRDLRLDAALVARLRHRWPDMPVPGYGVRHSAFDTPANSMTYSTLERALEGYRMVDGDLGRPIPWIARPGFVRRADKHPGMTVDQLTVTELDFGAQLVLAAERGAETVIIWDDENASSPEAIYQAAEVIATLPPTSPAGRASDAA